jgi:hypothetical protein
MEQTYILYQKLVRMRFNLNSKHFWWFSVISIVSTRVFTLISLSASCQRANKNETAISELLLFIQMKSVKSAYIIQRSDALISNSFRSWGLYIPRRIKPPPISGYKQTMYYINFGTIFSNVTACPHQRYFVIILLDTSYWRTQRHTDFTLFSFLLFHVDILQLFSFFRHKSFKTHYIIITHNKYWWNHNLFLECNSTVQQRITLLKTFILDHYVR